MLEPLFVIYHQRIRGCVAKISLAYFFEVVYSQLCVNNP